MSPLIVLLAVILVLFVLLGFTVAGGTIYVVAKDKSGTDNSGTLAAGLFMGLLISGGATGGIAAMAYRTNGPTCSLAPSALVEKPSP